MNFMQVMDGPNMCFTCGLYSNKLIGNDHFNNHMKNGELPTKYKVAKYKLVFKLRVFIDKVLNKI